MVLEVLISKQMNVKMNDKMKHTMNVIIAILFTYLFIACDKPPVDPPADVEEVLEIEWASRLDPNRTFVNHNNGVIYQDEFIYFGDIDDPATIYAYNLDTGEKAWTYQYEGWDISDVEYNYIVDGIILCVTSNRVFGFDIQKRESIWEINFDEKNVLRSAGNIASNGKFYQVGTFNFNPSGGGVAHMYEIDPYSGDYNQIYAKAPDSIGTTTVSPPVVWEDTENGR
ncbi:MAG: outer membrane protein assembly factor BamB, partial [Halioglobus sp.]